MMEMEVCVQQGAAWGMIIRVDANAEVADMKKKRRVIE